MTTKKIEGMNPDACYAFAGVPNNRTGRRFIAMLSKYRNPGVIERVRSRVWQMKPGEKRPPRHHDPKMAQAKTLRVYLDRDDTKHYERLWQVMGERDAAYRTREAEVLLRLSAEAERDRAVEATTPLQAQAAEGLGYKRERDEWTDRATLLGSQLNEITGERDMLRRERDELVALLDGARDGWRKAQVAMNEIPTWMLTCLGLARELRSWLRRTTGDLFVGIGT